MSDYVCPVCAGGFPADALVNDVACPWCHFELGEGEKLRGGAEFANKHNTL